MMPAENPPGTPKQIVKSINILFYAILIGLIFFSIIIYFLGYVQGPITKEKNIIRFLLIAILFIASLIITVAERFYKKRLLSAKQFGVDLIGKLSIYRAALIVVIAIYEGLGLFAAMLYILTGNTLFFVIVAIILMGMFLKRPQKLKIFNDLELNSEEQLELN